MSILATFQRKTVQFSGKNEALMSGGIFHSVGK